MASVIPKFYKKEVIDVLVTEDLWLMLLNDSHVPNASTQQYVSQVVANEISDTGANYVAGGIQLSGKTSQDDGNNAYLRANNIEIGPGSTFTYRWGILYTKTGGTSQATYRIRAHVDFLANQPVSNGTTLIQWNALGIIYVE